MRNSLALVGAAVVAFGGLGYYLDWFKVRSTPSTTGHQSLNIDIDTVKIKDDLHRGTVKVQEILEKKKQDAEVKVKDVFDAKPLPKTNLSEIKSEFKKALYDEVEEAEEFINRFNKAR